MAYFPCRVNVALMHPRLFTTLVLLDPVIQQFSSAPPESGESPARLSTFRRDKWPSRKAAAEGYKRSKFYQAWDPRVIDRLVNFGLRELPTPIYPEPLAEGSEKPVTLTTTRHQEVFTFLRPNFEGSGHKNQPVNRSTQPDLDPAWPTIYPFYRSEGPATFLRLPNLRPSVRYVFGGTSYLSSPDLRKEKLETTGVGVGGSGGAKEGRVDEVVIKDVGHLVAMEAVEQCADFASEWISKEMQKWKPGEEESKRAWAKKTLLEKITVDEKWKEMVGGPPRVFKQEGKPKL